MGNYKIKVTSEAESKEVQELFFELGYKWLSSGISIQRYKEIYADQDGDLSSTGTYKYNFETITIKQLRDLVVLHRNDVKDANWVTEGDDQIYKDSSGKSFIFREQGWDELQRHEMRQAMWEKVKPKPQPTEAEQGLISGADALKAMIEGKRVLYSGYKNQDWDTALNCNLGVFLKHEKFPDFSFKIVPRTIKLELEIPAPFEPKDGDCVWGISDDHACGYFSVEWHQSQFFHIGVFSTEEEIKQVVAALRNGLKGNN